MWKNQVVPTREKALIKESFQAEKGHPALRLWGLLSFMTSHWMQKGLGKSPDLGWASSLASRNSQRETLSSELFANISPRTWEISCLCLRSLLFTGETWGWDGADCSSGLWRSKWRPWLLFSAGIDQTDFNRTLAGSEYLSQGSPDLQGVLG